MKRIEHITDLLGYRILLLTIEDEKAIIGWLLENIGWGMITSISSLNWLENSDPVWVGTDRYYRKTWLPGAYFYFKHEDDAVAIKLRWL